MKSSQMIRRATRLALAIGISAPLVPSALAADAPSTDTAQQTQNLGNITVTGSRIKRSDVETAQPILRITQQDIKETGLQTLGQILQNITASGAAQNTQTNNGGSGESHIDLRYLGSGRVLVLLNGHRWLAGLGGSVDLNQIPLSIVDHIEVLQDGASAVYGSDAIAGVINIITKNNYNGAEATAYYGEWMEDGDRSGGTQHYSFSMGSSNDHSAIFFNSAYYQQNKIYASERKATSTVYPGTGNTRGSSATPQGRFMFWVPPSHTTDPTGADPNNAPSADTGLTAAQCPATSYTTGVYMPFCDLTVIKGTNGSKPSDFRPFKDPQDRYNYAPGELILTPYKNTSLYVQGHYDLSPNLTFQANALYNRHQSETQLYPTELFVGPSSTSTAMANIPAHSQDPYNPFDFALTSTHDSNTGAAPNIYFLGRDLTEEGERTMQRNDTTYRFEGGFSGNFLTGTTEWDWDFDYIYGSNRQDEVDHGWLNVPRLTRSISDCPAEGPTDFAAGVTCVPFNIFGGQGANGKGTITPAMLNYALEVEKETVEQDAHIYDVDITTSNLAELPAGNLGLALGFERRSNSGSFIPDPNVAVGDSSSSPRETTVPLSGSVSVNSVYGEVNIPILADLPGAHSLSLDLAERHSDYNTFGTTSNGRAGLKWQPIRDLLIRASWSQGYRAPTVSDLYSGVGHFYAVVTDPCDNYPASTNAAIRKNCAAQGVPPGYRANLIGEFPASEGSNPNLNPETSISRTIGFVYSPSWAPGLNLQADYYKIELENSIGTVGSQTLLDFCYESGIECSAIKRSPSGGIININDVLTNIGGLLTEGIDGGITYKFPSTSFGDFSADLESTYVERYDIYLPVPGGGRLDTQIAGTSGTGNGFGNGIPHYKTHLALDWAYGNWSANLTIYYISHTTEDCSAGLENTPLSLTNLGLCSYPNFKDGSLSKNNVASRTWEDAQVSYDFVAANTNVSFGVINLFDTQPPREELEPHLGWDHATYPELLGRFPYLEVTKRF